jgi:hypothetical protein
MNVSSLTQLELLAARPRSSPLPQLCYSGQARCEPTHHLDLALDVNYQQENTRKSGHIEFRSV